MNSRIIYFIGLSLVALMSLQAQGQPKTNASSPLVLTRTIVLDGATNTRTNVGVPGRIDHMAYDPTTQRLFVAALENGSLEVVDLKSGQRIRSIGNLQLPQGAAVIPASGAVSNTVVAVACGGDGTLHIYDTTTLQEVKNFVVGPDADNVRYVASRNAVLVSYGSTNSGAIALFNSQTWDKMRDIGFPSRPESFQIDPETMLVFANLPQGVRSTTLGEVGVGITWLDESRIYTDSRLAPIPLNVSRNFPMALDSAYQRLFIASRKPSQLLLIDFKKNKILSQTPCTDDSDDLFYDHMTGYVFVIGGGFRPDLQEPSERSPLSPKGEMGAIDVFSVGADNKLIHITSVPTARHARTALFVLSRHALYVAVPPLDGKSPEIREYKFK